MYERHDKGRKIKPIDDGVSGKNTEKNTPDDLKDLSTDEIKKLLIKLSKERSKGTLIRAEDVGGDAQVELRGSAIALMVMSLCVVKSVFDTVCKNEPMFAKSYVKALMDFTLDCLKHIGGDDE